MRDEGVVCHPACAKTKTASNGLSTNAKANGQEWEDHGGLRWSSRQTRGVGGWDRTRGISACCDISLQPKKKSIYLAWSGFAFVS